MRTRLSLGYYFQLQLMILQRDSGVGLFWAKRWTT